MTKPRKQPSTKFHAFLVEPQPGFRPTNWQQNPEHYRILEYNGPKHFKGRADAWKFLHNHGQLNQSAIKTWAIYLDFNSSFLSIEPAEQDTTFESVQRNNLVSVDAVDVDQKIEITPLGTERSSSSPTSVIESARSLP